MSENNSQYDFKKQTKENCSMLAFIYFKSFHDTQLYNFSLPVGLICLNRHECNIVYVVKLRAGGRVKLSEPEFVQPCSLRQTIYRAFCCFYF